MKQEQEFFEVLNVCKDDLRGQFKDNPKALKKIDEMDDGEMKYFAGKFGDALMEDYWTALKIVFEIRFLKED